MALILHWRKDALEKQTLVQEAYGPGVDLNPEPSARGSGQML